MLVTVLPSVLVIFVYFLLSLYIYCVHESHCINGVVSPDIILLSDCLPFDFNNLTIKGSDFGCNILVLNMEVLYFVNNFQNIAKEVGV